MNASTPHLHLKPRALYEEVAELLRQRIFSRELQPGEWIDELAISSDYGISRTPLREALKVLAAEGLVTMKPRRGAYVTEVSARDLSEVYHLLGLLEGDAAAAVGKDLHYQRLQPGANFGQVFEEQDGLHGDAFAVTECGRLMLTAAQGVVVWRSSGIVRRITVP